MIRLVQVGKKYGELEAVKNLNLTIDTGEICVLLGPSGCGKSTTLRMINRLIATTQGEIYIDDKNINDYPVEELRKGIGYVVQSTGLFPHMNVEENISIVPKLLKWEKQKVCKKVDEMLELVGLTPEIFRKKYPYKLSGGEAQRVGVARALAANPPIILMDEPFGAVDPLNRKRLQCEFLKIQQEVKKTVVFVTHDVEEAIRMGNKIAIMNQGRMEEYDTPHGLIINNNNQFVKDFLGGEYAIKLLTKFELRDVMRNNIPTIRFHDLPIDTSLQEALSYMIEKSINQVGVVDSKGTRVGIATVDNIIHILKNTEEV